jgi:hypothetical protein
MSTTPNPNDAIRRAMLRYFYDRNASATSIYGKKGSAVKISDVKRDLKAKHSLTQAEVVSNLNYLLDREWVKELKVEKEVRPGGGTTTVPSVTSFYEITALGIDRIEGGSEFEHAQRYGDINIQAAGANVITLGDGNIVNASFDDLRIELDELKRQLIDSDQLTEDAKLDAAVDIETIKDQLAKSRPDPLVVRTLWSRVEKAAALAGLAELAVSAGHLIVPLIS